MQKKALKHSRGPIFMTLGQSICSKNLSAKFKTGPVMSKLAHDIKLDMKVVNDKDFPLLVKL